MPASIPGGTLRKGAQTTIQKRLNIRNIAVRRKNSRLSGQHFPESGASLTDQREMEVSDDDQIQYYSI